MSLVFSSSTPSVWALLVTTSEQASAVFTLQTTQVFEGNLGFTFSDFLLTLLVIESITEHVHYQIKKFVLNTSSRLIMKLLLRVGCSSYSVALWKL